MKVKVIIEEIRTQTFEVEVSNLDNAYEEIRDDYKNGFIKLSRDAQVLEANMTIADENGDGTEWRNMHV